MKTNSAPSTAAKDANFAETNSASSAAAKDANLAETGTNDNTAVIAGVAATLITAGGGTALAVRRRKTRHAA
ncbi:LAETG motif-containing sortase-dependent surface protein [Streptomyces rectiviolaceus]